MFGINNSSLLYSHRPVNHGQIMLLYGRQMIAFKSPKEEMYLDINFRGIFCSPPLHNCMFTTWLFSRLWKHLWWKEFIMSWKGFWRMSQWWIYSLHSPWCREPQSMWCAGFWCTQQRKVSPSLTLYLNGTSVPPHYVVPLTVTTTAQMVGTWPFSHIGKHFWGENFLISGKGFWGMPQPWGNI